MLGKRRGIVYWGLEQDGQAVGRAVSLPMFAVRR
jgi:hypothetical protein